MLHTGNVIDSQSLTMDNDNAFCSFIATFFVNKVHNIETAITADLSQHDPDTFSADLPHGRPCLTAFSPVTSEEVGRLLH